MAASHTRPNPTGDQTCNPSSCPDPESIHQPGDRSLCGPMLNQLSHTRQGPMCRVFNLMERKAGMKIPFNKHALSAHCLPVCQFPAAPGNRMVRPLQRPLEKSHLASRIHFLLSAYFSTSGNCVLSPLQPLPCPQPPLLPSAPLLTPAP